MRLTAYVVIGLLLPAVLPPSLSVAATPGGERTTAFGSWIAKLSVKTLQMLQVEPGSAHGGRWLVWSEGRGEGQSASIALFSPDGVCIWHVVKPDAYQPTMTSVPEWSWKGRSVSLLLLSYGADAQEAEILALDADGSPRVLDRRSASRIFLRSGSAQLELDQAAGSVPEKTCLRWSAPGAKLLATGCAE